MPLVVYVDAMQAAAPTWFATSARFNAETALSDSRVVTTEMPCAASMERKRTDRLSARSFSSR